MKKILLKWELWGIAFVFFLGALLHFLFEWSGSSPLVGWFASVNESVWEHFKQGFWPMCLYAVIEHGFIRKSANNFFTAKAIAVYMIPVIETVIFYSYTSLTGKEILIVDILTFVIAVIAAQLTGYRIMTSRPLPKYAATISIVFIVLMALALIVFTFYPPHLPILMDHNTGSYGIP
jgi:hypothetical protein